jgi:hypothetical protein
MSKDGHGFELPVDPRISARQAAADRQRALNAAQTPSASYQARARRDQLALDREHGDRSLRRNPGSPEPASLDGPTGQSFGGASLIA